MNYSRRFIANLLPLYSDREINLNLLSNRTTKDIWEDKGICQHHRFIVHLEEDFHLNYVLMLKRTTSGVLTQENEKKEYEISYIGRGLLDLETRYAHIEKVCLLIYYACVKRRHYYCLINALFFAKLTWLSINYIGQSLVEVSANGNTYLLSIIWLLSHWKH